MADHFPLQKMCSNRIVSYSNRAAKEGVPKGPKYNKKEDCKSWGIKPVVFQGSAI